MIHCTANSAAIAAIPCRIVVPGFRTVPASTEPKATVTAKSYDDILENARNPASRTNSDHHRHQDRGVHEMGHPVGHGRSSLPDERSQAPAVPFSRNRPHIWTMIKAPALLLAVLYGLVMWLFSAWRLKAQMDATSTPLAHPALEAELKHLADVLDLERIRVNVARGRPRQRPRRPRRAHLPDPRVPRQVRHAATSPPPNSPASSRTNWGTSPSAIRAAA